MKNIFALTAAFLIIMQAAAQDTVEITERPYGTMGPAEIFSVLKSNKKVRHGSFKKLNADQKVIATGYYKEGKKDGAWEEFSWKGDRLLYRGQYTNDEKTGVWEYHNPRGELEQKYDHSAQQMLYVLPKNKDSIYIVCKGNDTVHTTLDQPAILIGGTYTVQQTMSKNLRYPEKAIDEKKQGRVLISFDIDTDGSVSNYKLVKSVYKHLDDEAMRVVKLIPQQWLPAVKDGQKVKVRHFHPVTFNLEK